LADDFCIFFDSLLERNSLKTEEFPQKRKYYRQSKQSKAEIMPILILVYASGYRCLKHYYLGYVCVHLKHLFPTPVSCNRFVELEKDVALPMAVFIKKVLLGKCTGTGFVDNTTLRVCRNQRILMHKFFTGIAARGKCSMGWFFGFKLHPVCNEHGELLNFMFTPGDIDGGTPPEEKNFLS
jgi:hypothetical protein